MFLSLSSRIVLIKPLSSEKYYLFSQHIEIINFMIHYALIMPDLFINTILYTLLI